MKFSATMTALLNGKKVRDKKWGEGAYIYLTKAGFLIDECNNEIYDFKLSENFEVYKEPQETVKMAPYVYKASNGGVYASMKYYKNDDDFTLNGGFDDDSWFKRLDALEVEVPE